MNLIQHEIEEFATGILLRYFRPGKHSQVGIPRLKLARDMEMLRAHWALSQSVRQFLKYILAHRHETRSLFQNQQRSFDAFARGRIDARKTLLTRRVTGHPSVVVCDEPVRSFNTGPNQVVAWVVHAAATFVSQLHTNQRTDSFHDRLIEDTMRCISEVKRLEAMREVSKGMAINKRPVSGAIRNAARSRRMLYRLAVIAYETLSQIEVGEKKAIRKVLGNTLIEPFEDWRRFELAVGLGIGEAIASVTRKSMNLAIIGEAPTKPIVSCGQYEVYWQGAAGLFVLPQSHPSEARLNDLLNAYGMPHSIHRPDLMIVDRAAKRVLGIVEIKYSPGKQSNARFREAAEQIVRYARAYARDSEIDRLVRASLIALSHDSPTLLDEIGDAPRSVDFAGMKSGVLRSWVRDRLFAPIVQQERNL